MIFKLLLLSLIQWLSDSRYFTEAFRLVAEKEWHNYKQKFNKTYPSKWAENNAQAFYASNKVVIDFHNDAYEAGLMTYGLAVNQFTDMNFERSKKLFGKLSNNIIACESVQVNSSAFTHSFDYLSKGYHSNVQDQGMQCNSGWAYAAVTALEFSKKNKNYTHKGDEKLLVQHLIDYAGDERGCKNQTPHVAYDYLKKCCNRSNAVKNICKLPQNFCWSAGFVEFVTLPDGDDSKLAKTVKNISPVVIKFSDLSFNFVHYSEGLYVPYTSCVDRSHYMTVVGYGVDVNGRSYWKLQNSFGAKWGKNGYIRVQRNPKTSIAKSPVYPTMTVDHNETKLRH